MDLSKNRYNKLLILLLYFASPSLFAQQNIPFFGKQPLICGYEKDVSGEVLTYYSSKPDFAKDALLTRCTAGQKMISWKTAKVPDKLSEQYYYFYCLAGHSSGTSGADRKFSLSINGIKYLTIITPAKKKPPYTWTYSGKDSVAVVFVASKTDVHKDLFGDLYLRIPKKLLEAGKALTISITGDAENSFDWFMIFRYTYVEKLSISPTPFLVNTAKGIKQIVQLNIDHVFPDAKLLTLTINNKVNEIKLKEGVNKMEIAIDTTGSPKKLSVTAKIGKLFYKEFNLMQNPVSFREVNIIHHSHNDIGYSHLQEEVMKVQYQNILDALNMIDKTANYPAGSSFVWNEETLWPVEYFLKNAPEKDKTRFINAVKSNKIALSAFYVGVMTGLCSAAELKWLNEYAVYLKDKYQFPINTAMFSDIPGLSWGVTDALLSDGIKYLSNGPNYIPAFPDKGERVGSIYRYLADKPFYWNTTKGNDKLLVWTTGLGYSAFHQIPFPDLGNKIKEKLLTYLNELDTVNYPYDMIQLRYTIKSDNGPVDTTLCDFVRDWNIKYVSPKLVIANVAEMMEKFEKKYGNILPVLSGDFTPYWEDGAYSTAAEESENRILSDKVQQMMILAGMMPGKKVDPQWFYEARKNVIMFSEHTWGAWNSISNPDDAFAVNQWLVKKAFIDSTKKYLALISSVLTPTVEQPTELTLYNTLARIRTAYVETTLPANLKGNALTDDKGNIIPIQYLDDGKVCFIAKDIPALGSRKYKLIQSGNKPLIVVYDFVCKIDTITGALTSVVYQNKEWVNAKDFKGLNQALYIKGLDPSNYSTSKVFNVELIENGPVCKTIHISCEMEGSKKLSYYITQYKGFELIKFSCVIDKTAIREKEAMHLVFPFNIEEAVNRIGLSDTFYIPGQGQIPGSNKDYFSVQQWLDISNTTSGVTVCSPQVALFELGSITDERPVNGGVKKWKENTEPSSVLFLYLLNNYWNTNFKADQDGIIHFDCYVYFHKAFDQEKAKHFGEELHFPLLPVWE
jgi:alpha-mannosidase